MPTATFTANFMVSLQNNGKLENQMRQGFMAADGGSGDSCRWAGFCGFNYSAMNSTLNTMIIDGITMSMTSSAYGLSNSYSLNLYKAPYQAGTNNSFLIPNDYNPQSEIYALSSYFTTPEFARNQTRSFSLPIDYLQHIRNGYLIACYRRTSINTPTNSHYTRGFEEYPTITVTYHAPVSDFTLNKSTVDAGQVITATVTPSDSSYAHRITWKLNDTYKSTPYASMSTTFPFTIPFGSGSPATNNWCTAIPNGTSITCTCTVETLDGGAGTVLGSKTKTFTMTVPTSVKPTIDSLSAALVDGYSGIYLQNRSKATLTANNPQGIYGSTISSYSIGGGSTNPFTTGVFSNTGDITFSATVTDSRGRTSDPVTVTISVVAYSPPRITRVLVSRASDSSGTLSDEGTYVKCSIWYTWTNLGSNTNSTTLSYRENVYGSSYAGDTTQSISSGGYYVLGSGGTFDTLKSYVIRFVFSDGTGAADVATFTLYNAETFFDWDPVNDSACFGGFATRPDTFEISPLRKLVAYGEQIGVPSNPNLLINPDFQVWQRGTSFTTTGSARYTADRWLMSYNVPSVSKVNDGARIQFTTAWQRFQQSIEGHFAAETKVTCSTVIKSSSARPLAIYLYTDGNAVDGLPISATTSYALFSKSFTIPSNTTSVSVILQNTTTLTSNVDVQYIKLELGIVATPSSPRPYPQELLMSQRYCQSLVPIRIRASNITTGYIDFLIPLVAPMRIVPTLPSVLSVCTTAGSAQTGFTFSVVTSEANFGYLNVRATKASHGLSDAQLLISPTGFLEADF